MDLILESVLNAKDSKRRKPIKVLLKMMPGLMIAMPIGTHVSLETPMEQEPMKILIIVLIQESVWNAKDFPRRRSTIVLFRTMNGLMTAHQEETHGNRKLEVLELKDLLMLFQLDHILE